MDKFTWSRYYSSGYEVSSAGDRRFSAFYAKLSDAHSIEHHYQCNVKGYPSIQMGKGKPSLNHTDRESLYRDYLALWVKFFQQNRYLLNELLNLKPCVFTDRFASTNINQARAISDILNNYKDYF